MPSEASTHMPVTARFSDGRTAASRDVTARLGPFGIEIADPEISSTRTWPFSGLHAAEPITRHAIDALLTHASEPGATLFVSNAAFARELARRAPHLSAASERWRAARPWIWTAAALLLVGVGISAAGLSPARAIARLLPDSARAALGDQVVTSMTSDRALCTEPRGQAALARLSERLMAATGSQKTFQVVVVDWGLLNAFATPGERIVLTRGLIAKAKGPDEVAGVLAHEMGHGLELHPETGLVRSLGLAASLELLLGGSGGALANVGLLLAQLSYSREAEREADEQALRLLRNAGISNRGLIDFFDRVVALEAKEGPAGAVARYDVLRSHPQTVERKDRIAREPDYASTPSLSAADWADLQGICDERTGPEGARQQGPGAEPEMHVRQ